MGGIHSEGMTSLGLRYTLTLLALLQAHTQTHTCARPRPNSLRNEDGYASAQGVFMEENSQ